MENSIIQKLRELKPILKDRYGIEEFAVFGSTARGCATKDSDVDIAILKMDIKSGFDIINAKNFLKKTLQKEVDLGTFKSMKTFIKKQIRKDFIYV
jgi:predicted nucleotidyltransferase